MRLHLKESPADTVTFLELATTEKAAAASARETSGAVKSVFVLPRTPLISVTFSQRDKYIANVKKISNRIRLCCDNTTCSS